MEISETRIEFKKLLDEISDPNVALSRIQKCLSEGPRRKIEIHFDEYLLTMIKDEINFIWNPLDPRTAITSLVAIGQYEVLETILLKNLSVSAKTILDIGANVGYYSVILGSQLKKDQELYAFEPIKSSFAQLKRNIKLNNLEGKVKMFNLALSDKEETLKLFIPKTSGSSATSARLLHPEEENWIEEVHCQTLDSFMHTKQIDSCDLLKIDVEGAELQILNGAISTIDRFKPVIFTELLRKWSAAYDYHPNDVIKMLRELNFQCFCVNKNLTEIFEVTDKTIETNFIFIHESKVKNFQKMKLHEEMSA